MENASKALIIAGGILIALITISLFYFVFDQMGTLTEVADGNTLEVEVADFNKGFEAYNKKLMYGTDIISVLNKAIDNNTRYGATIDNENSDYYVNVSINLENGFSRIIETYVKQGTRYVKETSDDRTILRANRTYTLSDDYETLKSILIDVEGRIS